MTEEHPKQEPKGKRGRPPRELRGWTFDDHDHFMALYRRMQVGHNKGDRDMVDAAANMLIAQIDEARGK